jgi:hypothetical protein
MTYVKPQAVVLGEAVRLTQGQTKRTLGIEDFGGPSPVPADKYNTQPAYEADE